MRSGRARRRAAKEFHVGVVPTAGEAERRARQRLTVLTDREHEVALAVARGLSNAEIGRELRMSEATVKAHVSRALAKLGLTNRVQAAILVHDAGLTDGSGPRP